MKETAFVVVFLYLTSLVFASGEPQIIAPLINGVELPATGGVQNGAIGQLDEYSYFNGFRLSTTNGTFSRCFGVGSSPTPTSYASISAVTRYSNAIPPTDGHIFGVSGVAIGEPILVDNIEPWTVYAAVSCDRIGTLTDYSVNTAMLGVFFLQVPKPPGAITNALAAQGVYAYFASDDASGYNTMAVDADYSLGSYCQNQGPVIFFMTRDVTVTSLMFSIMVPNYCTPVVAPPSCLRGNIPCNDATPTFTSDIHLWYINNDRTTPFANLNRLTCNSVSQVLINSWSPISTFFGCPHGFNNAASYSWLISEPTSNEAPTGVIKLHFLYVDFENDADSISVYEGVDANAAALVYYQTRGSIPEDASDSIVVYSTEALIVFQTSPQIPLAPYRGFLMYYNFGAACVSSTGVTKLYQVVYAPYGTFGCTNGFTEGVTTYFYVYPLFFQQGNTLWIDFIDTHNNVNLNIYPVDSSYNVFADPSASPTTARVRSNLNIPSNQLGTSIIDIQPTHWNPLTRPGNSVLNDLTNPFISHALRNGIIEVTNSNTPLGDGLVVAYGYDRTGQDSNHVNCPGGAPSPIASFQTFTFFYQSFLVKKFNLVANQQDTPTPNTYAFVAGGDGTICYPANRDTQYYYYLFDNVYKYQNPPHNIPANTLFEGNSLILSVSWQNLEQLTFRIYDGATVFSDYFDFPGTAGVNGSFFNHVTKSSQFLVRIEAAANSDSDSQFLSLSWSILENPCYSLFKQVEIPYKQVPSTHPLGVVGCPVGIFPNVHAGFLIFGFRPDQFPNNYPGTFFGLITLSFTFFDMGNNANNYITVYDGASAYPINGNFGNSKRAPSYPDVYIPGDGSYPVFHNLFDEITGNANKIGSYSGNTIPPALMSTKPYVFIEITTDSNTDDVYGFVAAYTISTGTDPCMNGTALTKVSPFGSFECYGSISILNNNNRDIPFSSYWLINPNNGLIILQLSFFYSSDIQSNDANLAIFEGAEDTDTQLGLIYPSQSQSYSYYDPYSPDNTYSTFTFSGKVLLVRYTSGSIASNFHFTYRTTGVTCSTSGTSVTLTFNDGEFGCAGVSGSVTKEWIISPQQNLYSHISLDFDYFRLAKNLDYLYIYNGTTDTRPLLYSFTGSLIPPHLSIRGSNNLLVKLVTTSGRISGGFLLRYTVNNPCSTSQELRLTSHSNYISCLNFPGRQIPGDQYLNNGIISKFIIQPNNGQIAITPIITNFEGTICFLNGVINNFNEIYSIHDPNYATGDASICLPGNNPFLNDGQIQGTSPTWFSELPSATVVIITDQSPVSSSLGFSFSYTSGYGSNNINVGAPHSSCQNSVSRTITNGGSPANVYGCGANGNSIDGPYFNPNVTSEWLIRPFETYNPLTGDVTYGGGLITFTFVSITLNPGDEIILWDGPGAYEFPILARCTSGSSCLTSYTSSGMTLFLTASIGPAININPTRLTFSFETNDNPCLTSTNAQLTQSVGFVGCPNGVANNINSLFHIRPTALIGIPTSYLSLHLLYMNMEASHDNVTVYDGNSTAVVQAVYTGSVIPSISTNFDSTSNELAIRVQSDSAVHSSGFLFYYAVDSPCVLSKEVVYTNPSDTFGCTRGIANNIDSLFVIAPENGQIQLTFLSLDLNNATLADTDYITIYDGDNENAPIIVDQISGTSAPQIHYLSTGNTIAVRIRTTSTGISSGFEIHYRSGIFDPCKVSTNAVETETSKTITCNQFTPGIISRWLITPVDGSIRFSATSTNFVNGDILTFYDGDSTSDPILQQFTLANQPTDFTFDSTSPVVLVILQSAPSVLTTRALPLKSFTFTYTTIGNPCTRSQTVSLTAPNGSLGCGPVLDGIDSTWDINPNNGEIFLSFSEFKLNPPDAIFLYDGTTPDIVNPFANSPIYITGQEIPDAYQSNSNRLYVRLVTTAPKTSDGFLASYTTTGNPCTGANITYTVPSRYFGCVNTIPAGVYSTWYLKPINASSISLAILSNGVFNGNAFLKIYSGNSNQSPLIYTLTSSTQSSDIQNIFSPVGVKELFVELSTGTGSIGNGGVSMFYTSDLKRLCITSGNFILNELTGSFGCDVNADIANNLDTTWVVYPNSDGRNHSIELTLSAAPTFWDTGFDFLYVQDTTGTNVTSDFVNNPQIINNAGPYLTVILKTSQTFHSRGFTISWRVTDLANDYCFTDNTVSTATPSVGNPVNVKCDSVGNNVTSFVNVPAPASNTLIVTPQTFNFGTGDYVDIYNSNNVLLASYSGSSFSTNQIFSSIAIQFRITTDNIPENNKLFDFLVEASDSPCYVQNEIETFTAPSGVISCDNMGQITSYFSIRAGGASDNTKSIHLTWSELNFARNRNRFDLFEISYGAPCDNTVVSSPLAVYTGTTIPGPYTATAGLAICLRYTGAVPNGAFELRYALLGAITIPAASPSNSPSPGAKPSQLPFGPAPENPENPQFTPSKSPSPSTADFGVSNSPGPIPPSPEVPVFPPPSASNAPSSPASATRTPTAPPKTTITRTSTATASLSPAVAPTTESINVEVRLKCTGEVSTCCANFASAWASLSAINDVSLITVAICSPINSQTTGAIVEVFYTQFGSNFHSEEEILADYYSLAGCSSSNYNFIECSVTTTALNTADFSPVYTIEPVVNNYEYSFNTADVPDNGYYLTTYQGNFVGGASHLSSSLLLTIIMVLINLIVLY